MSRDVPNNRRRRARAHYSAGASAGTGRESKPHAAAPIKRADRADESAILAAVAMCRFGPGTIIDPRWGKLL